MRQKIYIYPGQVANKLFFYLALVMLISGCGGVVDSGSGSGSGSGSALVSWTPPTHNTDGTWLGDDLAGYRIYYGNSPGNYDNSVTIANPGLSSFQVDGLVASDTYFVMTAFNTVGIESSYSEEVYKRFE
jgi:hypothetical protein